MIALTNLLFAASFFVIAVFLISLIVRRSNK
jgi:hypothetical protein